MERTETLWINPLLAIEASVLEKAKHLSLDLDTTNDTSALRDLIEREVEIWQRDVHRGERTVSLADPQATVERAWRNLAGLGPLESLLADPDVWEISINAPDAIFVRRHAGISGYHDEVFHDDQHVTRTLTKILDDAGTSQRKLDISEGLQDAQLADGSRLHIVHGDIGRDGHTLINIRRHTGVQFHSLRELVERNMISEPAGAFLRSCIAAKTSIVFAGAPGSGKTTLLSCCASELDPSLRVVVAEEVFETNIPGIANVAHMQTRPARPDRPAVDLRRLVAGFLRMAPDIAIVGEVRDKEALPLLLTLSSGVKGFTTIHAGSARQALTRLRFICQLAETSNELPMRALNALVSEAIDIVVHCERGPNGPRVTEIIAVEDLQAGPDSTTFTTTQIFALRDEQLVWSGAVPTRLSHVHDFGGS